MQMDPQKHARIAGWLFIATIVTSIPAALLYGPVLHHHNYIVGGGNDTRIAVGAFLEILLVIANIGTAVVLFPIVRHHSESMSLGYVAHVLSTFLLGPSFCAAFGNGILLGTVMYRSGLVPRGLALLGVIGGPLAFIAATGVLFNVYDQNSAAQSVLTIPEILWEVSLGVYLVVKGFTDAGLRALDLPRRPQYPPSPALAGAS